MVHIYERSGDGDEDGDTFHLVWVLSLIGTVILNLTFWVSVKKEVTRTKGKQYLVPLTTYDLFICDRISATGAFTCRRFDGMIEPCLYTFLSIAGTSASWQFATAAAALLGGAGSHSKKSDNLLCRFIVMRRLAASGTLWLSAVPSLARAVACVTDRCWLLCRYFSWLCWGDAGRWWHKESPYPPENEFPRALERRFLVTKKEAERSHFRPVGLFSWNVGNFISNILYFVKKGCPFYWLSHWLSQKL